LIFQHSILICAEELERDMNSLKRNEVERNHP